MHIFSTLFIFPVDLHTEWVLLSPCYMRCHCSPGRFSRLPTPEGASVACPLPSALQVHILCALMICSLGTWPPCDFNTVPDWPERRLCPLPTSSRAYSPVTGCIQSPAGHVTCQLLSLLLEKCPQQQPLSHRVREGRIGGGCAALSTADRLWVLI